MRHAVGRDRPSSVVNAARPLAGATQSAEYKQVTVLFADVVHSMDIAATVEASGCARSWLN